MESDDAVDEVKRIMTKTPPGSHPFASAQEKGIATRLAGFVLWSAVIGVTIMVLFPAIGIAAGAGARLFRLISGY